MDCACLIHGDAYDWCYVDNLWGMLRRHLGSDIQLHVFTEAHRPVPAPYIRHDLRPWSQAQGPRRAWWNKLQMVDQGPFSGPVLYVDLDVVILRDIRWMRDLDPRQFWTIRDFRWLWRPNYQGINSSIMLWSAPEWHHLVQHMDESRLGDIMRQHLGDQDYLTEIIPRERLAFFDDNRIQSWRWQVNDGGMDMRTRLYRRPGAGPVPGPDCDVVIFHGRPKPHQISSGWMQRHWQGLGQT